MVCDAYTRSLMMIAAVAMQTGLIGP